jgi:hypothetical protein
MSSEITIDQMIEWAERQEKQFLWTAEYKELKGEPVIAEQSRGNADIAKATADRLRAIRDGEVGR